MTTVDQRHGVSVAGPAHVPREGGRSDRSDGAVKSSARVVPHQVPEESYHQHDEHQDNAPVYPTPRGHDLFGGSLRRGRRRRFCRHGRRGWIRPDPLETAVARERAEPVLGEFLSTPVSKYVRVPAHARLQRVWRRVPLGHPLLVADLLQSAQASANSSSSVIDRPTAPMERAAKRGVNGRPSRPTRALVLGSSRRPLLPSLLAFIRPSCFFLGAKKGICPPLQHQVPSPRGCAGGERLRRVFCDHVDRACPPGRLWPTYTAPSATMVHALARRGLIAARVDGLPDGLHRRVATDANRSTSSWRSAVRASCMASRGAALSIAVVATAGVNRGG